MRSDDDSKSISSDSQLTIPEPLRFYSALDEEMFFHGLTSIAAIKSYVVKNGRPDKGRPNLVVLMLDKPVMEDVSLMNLIGLMARYSLDMSSLASQASEDNAVWFKDNKAYWFKNIFPSKTSK